MNFAPYQDGDPEQGRALSPPPIERPHQADPWGYVQQPADSQQRNVGTSAVTQQQGSQQRPSGFGNGIGADERNVDVYGTSLPLRLDIEACLAYLLLPPAGAAALLIFEHRSDFVRFHAWQSGLVFTLLFIIHIIFSFSSVISYLLLVFDLSLIVLLTWHAYTDAEKLDRYELPLFGRIASSFVDEE